MEFERGKNEQIQCPCCFNFSVPDWWEFCEVCFWQFEGEYDDINKKSGANSISLKEGRENYCKCGSCDPKFRYSYHVREPFDDELPKNNDDFGDYCVYRFNNEEIKKREEQAELYVRKKIKDTRNAKGLESISDQFASWYKIIKQYPKYIVDMFDLAKEIINTKKLDSFAVYIICLKLLERLRESKFERAPKQEIYEFIIKHLSYSLNENFYVDDEFKTYISSPEELNALKEKMRKMIIEVKSCLENM